MDTHLEKNQSDLTIGRKIAIVCGIALLFITVGFLLILPWQGPKRIGGEAVNSFEPIRQGHQALFAVTDSNGIQIGWESQVIDEVPFALINNFFVFGLFNDKHAQSANRLFGFDPNGTGLIDILPDSQIIQFKDYSKRSIDLNGNQRFWVSDLRIQSEQGEHLWTDIDATTLNSSQVISTVYTPPVPIWPISVGPNGQTIIGESTFRHSLEGYTSSADYKLLNNYNLNGKTFSPCVAVQFRLEMDAEKQQHASRRLNQIFCEEIGLVEEQRFDADGNLLETLTLVSTNRFDLDQNPIEAFPTQPISTAPNPISANLTQWQISPIIEMSYVGFGSQPSQPLTRLPFEEPLLISARASDASLMYSPNTGLLTSAFRTGNAIYGAPAVNPANGLIYFGSSDKSLYAINQLGMFVDSVRTNDSVATRPVFASDALWFGSEDGKIYCTTADLDTTNLKTLDLDAPVAASPVVWQNRAIFGGDSGDLVAVDTNCSELWRYSAGDPIDAPLAILDDTIYFAGHGLIGALEAKSGTEIWSAELQESIHTQPALLNDSLYVTDVFNQLHAYNRISGQLLWTKANIPYFGSVQIVGEQLLVNSTDELILLDQDGNQMHSWSMTAAKEAFLQTVPDLDLTFPDSTTIFSPVLGENRFWIIDDAGYIYQIAPVSESTP